MMKFIQKISQNIWIIAILLVGVFLRFYHLDFQTAWLDEVLVLKETELGAPFKEVYASILLRDSTSFLHLFSIRYLSFLLGHTIVTARLVSAIAGVLSIWYIYKLGTVMLNRRVGYFAAILLTLNLFHIEYSQEARSYALLILFVIIAFYRLYIYINKSTLLNALYLGVWMGLITNAHPIGLLNVATIFIILFFVFLSKKDWQTRINIIKGSVVSGIVTLLIFSFIFPIVLAASKITSFWIAEPSLERIKQVFTELAGRSELLLGIVIVSLLFFTAHAIRSVKKSQLPLLENNLFFSYAVLFIWIFLEVAVVLIKSYTDVSILLSRYLIAILPAMVLVVAIAIDLIKNKLLKLIVLGLLVCYSIYNTFYVTNYYDTIAKAQFEKTADFITQKNEDNDKVVSRYGWVMSYYINLGNPDTEVIENTLDNFIGSMKSKSIETESFWYFDGNSADYIVSTENQKFLDEFFKLKENKKMFDCWAKHFVLKNAPPAAEQFINGEMKLSFKDFKPLQADGMGNALMFQNGVLKSSAIRLPKGSYVLVVNGNSLPTNPIQGQNAHLKISINDKPIGDFFLSEKRDNSTNEIKFKNSSEKITLSIEFDNDIAIGELDRNVILYSLMIKSD